MPKLRESTTAVIVRGERVENGFSSEPYEAGWAVEAVVFLLGMDDGEGGEATVEISPDGMHWAHEGAVLAIPARGEVAFARVARFGNWLRLGMRLPEGGARRVMATLHLKG